MPSGREHRAVAHLLVVGVVSSVPLHSSGQVIVAPLMALSVEVQLLVLSSTSSTTGYMKSQGKNYANHKLLIDLRLDGDESAEFPAIAEGSAPMLGPPVHGAGSAVGRTDLTQWEQEHG